MRKKSHILIAGAGEAGRMLLAEFVKRGRAVEIIGFVDDDPGKTGTVIDGKMVLGKTSDVTVILERNDVSRVIIAMPSAPHGSVNRVVGAIIAYNPGIHIHIIPQGEKFFDTVPLYPSLQEFTLSDLLKRDEYDVDIDAIEKKLSGRTILITGAGGSIGSEICRQLLKFNVGKIIAVGRGEFSIYTLVKSLNEYMDFMERKPRIVYRIADVKEGRMLEKVFQEHRPEIVFHAAAHKHVPLMEYNEGEAILNNVQGTRNVLDLSVRYGVDQFIFISTDKAVRPTSVMGATKRLAEMVTALYNGREGLRTAIVRFGNVIGSRGSVIPLFREQIERGGPVTVTDPGVTRYFMSIPEASLLVINAAALSGGGEIFVLDMGEQYLVQDIARRLIELYGYRPDIDIKIEFTGLRPGEKGYEELFYEDGDLVKTDNDKILVKMNNTGIPAQMIFDFLDRDVQGLHELSSLAIRQRLKKLVPDYEFTEDRKDETEGRYVN